MDISVKETLRYLGYGSKMADDTVMDMIDECIEDVHKYANTKSVSKRFNLVIHEDGSVEAAGIRVQSKSLFKNLKDCEEVIFFAATLGTDIDRMLNRYLKLNIAKAAVFQAAAASAIESYCDECQRYIEEQMNKEGLYVRPRFSPGYGDLPLSIQGQFLDVLNASKTTGIVLSEGDIMIPEKSVSAIMGLSRTNSRCVIHGCESCTKKDCKYRRCF